MGWKIYFLITAAVALVVMIWSSCSNETKTEPAPKLPDADASMIIDHTCRNIDSIPADAIAKAKSLLHIAYGHTSHGTQLVTGMEGLIGFLSNGSLYTFNSGGTDGALDLRDRPFSGASDLGAPDFTAWATATRDYLDAHNDVNVIIWSWCGQLSSASTDDVDTYLDLMSGLESVYGARGVKFVYMTGHLDGYGPEGTLHKNNERIRAYCREHKKILYDFADIESYNPDNVYFLDKDANDNCDYDGNGDNQFDGNWAIEWQNAHPGEWYTCEAQHTQPLNANLKAYAAWWLWARLGGWSGPK